MGERFREISEEKSACANRNLPMRNLPVFQIKSLPEPTHESANMTSATSIDALLRMSHWRSRQVDRQKALACARSESCGQVLGGRWKTGVPDQQGRGSGVAGDVDAGRASYREHFDGHVSALRDHVHRVERLLRAHFLNAAADRCFVSRVVHTRTLV